MGCGCECCHGGFCGGCGHAGCGGRQARAHLAEVDGRYAPVTERVWRQMLADGGHLEQDLVPPW